MVSNHQSSLTWYYLHLTEKGLNVVPSFPSLQWQPQDADLASWCSVHCWGDSTENHPGGCTLGRAVAPQTAGFPLAPKNLALGGTGFHSRRLTQGL